MIVAFRIRITDAPFISTHNTPIHQYNHAMYAFDVLHLVGADGNASVEELL